MQVSILLFELEKNCNSALITLSTLYNILVVADIELSGVVDDVLGRILSELILS
jgi:hypothetical protein